MLANKGYKALFKIYNVARYDILSQTLVKLCKVFKFMSKYDKIWNIIQN